MTREEALQILDTIPTIGEQVDALEMAIQALSQEPCTDAVSRQAILDGIEELKQSPWCTDKRGNGFEYLITEALDVVKDLCVKQVPSVNPQPCDDAISREDAIAKIYDEFMSADGAVHIPSVLKVMEIIRELPSVTHKSGKWIDYRDDGFVECPFCGHATNCEDNIDELHYCFFCGARMVKPQERSE